MQEHKITENSRYTINRVFSKTNTVASLIEQKIINDKTQRFPLTARTTVMYNEANGSIPSKEVL